MPPKGYKSVTIPEELYRELKRYWRMHERELRRMGIPRFSNFVHKLLYDAMRRHERHRTKSAPIMR